MYLIEWAEGSEAQTTRPPSAIVHVNHAIGGWKYGHWEAVLDKSLSHYMIQLKTTLGDKLDKVWAVFLRYFVPSESCCIHLVSWLFLFSSPSAGPSISRHRGGHEGAVNLAINRADWTWNRELSQGWACGTGHILANRLSYSSSLDRFARTGSQK